MQSYASNATDKIGINSSDVCWVSSSGAWKAFGSTVRQYGSGCVGGVGGGDGRWRDGDCFSVVLDFNSGQVISRFHLNTKALDG